MKNLQEVKNLINESPLVKIGTHISEINDENIEKSKKEIENNKNTQNINDKKNNLFNSGYSEQFNKQYQEMIFNLKTTLKFKFECAKIKNAFILNNNMYCITKQRIIMINMTDFSLIE